MASLVHSGRTFGSIFLVLIHLILQILLIKWVANQLSKISSDTSWILVTYIFVKGHFGKKLLLRILSNSIVMRLLHLLMGLSDLFTQKSSFLFTRRINDVSFRIRRNIGDDWWNHKRIGLRNLGLTTREIGVIVHIHRLRDHFLVIWLLVIEI